MHGYPLRSMSLVLVLGLLLAPAHLLAMSDGMAADTAELAAMPHAMDSGCDMGHDETACPDCVSCIAGLVNAVRTDFPLLVFPPAHVAVPDKWVDLRNTLRPPRP